MVTIITIGLVKIPIMLVNSVNSRYSLNQLHLFSICCNEKVGNRRYCKSCGKNLTGTETNKGLNKETILTKEQEERLKELLENGIIEVLLIGEINQQNLVQLIPFIIKSQYILPSISKGYRKVDIKTYFSFVNALKEFKKVLICKSITRGVEHLGILIVLGEDLMFLEFPFKHYHNMDEVKRMKEQVNSIIEIDKINPLQFKNEASDFLKNYKTKEKTITKNNLFAVTEEKKVLMNKFIEEIISGKVKNTPKREIKSEVNPFSK